jgi:hypothetical protein
VAALYKLARLNFDVGNYGVTWTQLSAVISLSSDDSDLRFSALWGKLSASIVLQRFDVAWEDIRTLRDVIDRRGAGDLTALQQRTWYTVAAAYIRLITDSLPCC